MNIKNTAWRIALYVALNVIIMAAICLGVFFGVREQVSDSVVDRADDMLREYMVTVRNSNLHIEQIEQGYTEEFGDLISPYIDIAFYRRRPSGEADFVTASSFLVANDPMLTYTDGLHTELVAGSPFRTYTERIYPEQGEYYIKLFLSLDVFSAVATSFVGVAGVIIIVVFVLVSAALIAITQLLPYVRYSRKEKLFIREMSHELRTPLTVIKGTVEHILDTPDASVSEISGSLVAVMSETERMIRMSRWLGRINAPTRDAMPDEECDLTSVTREISEVYAEIFAEKDMPFSVRIDEVRTRISEDMWRQILFALLDNELKYAGEGSSVWLDLSRHGSELELVVSDNGAGVKDPEKIFKRFYREEEKPDVKGTGLGLAIVKNIVESNDGSVFAGEREGGGFLIKIRLKIHRAQKREEKGSLPEEKKEGQGRKKQEKNEGQGQKAAPEGREGAQNGQEEKKA